MVKMSKFFNELEDKRTPIKKEDRSMYIEPSDVLGVEPKTRQFESWFLNCFEYSSKSKMSIPEDIKKRYQGVRVDREYLQNLLDVLKGCDYDEYEIKIHVGNNAPLIVETREAKFYIAPRIDEDTDFEDITKR